MAKKTDLVYGFHPILELLEQNKPMNQILIDKAIRDDRVAQVLRMSRKQDIPVKRIPKERLNSLCRSVHQGIIAFISPIEFSPIDEVVQLAFENGESPMIVVLDGITDVRNLGAIARSAHEAGAHALVIPTQGSAQVSADALKTSAGALSHIPVCRVSKLIPTLLQLRDSGLKIIAATEKTATSIYDLNLADPIAIVMGAEDVGPSEEALRIVDSMAALPSNGKIGSLNVSVAAGVFLFEALRQRRLK